MAGFNPVRRKTLTTGQNEQFAFGAVCSGVTIENMSTTDSIFFKADSPASVDGEDCIEILPGMGRDYVGVFSEINIICVGAAKVQLVAER